MVRLEAKYEIDLMEVMEGAFHINRPMTNYLRFSAKINDFDVELCLDPKKSPLMEPSVDPSGEKYWPISKISIIVGRNEDIAPPIPMSIKYLAERTDTYRNAALETANRAIRFFKYKLHNPNLLG